MSFSTTSGTVIITTEVTISYVQTIRLGCKPRQWRGFFICHQRGIVNILLGFFCYCIQNLYFCQTLKNEFSRIGEVGEWLKPTVC
jgi:hypothetical protein